MKSSKKGFTIIEVVLVLAIAGLIFLMVFIALPALQRSQRNTQRRQDLSRIKAAVESYKANNRNDLPFKKNGSTVEFDVNFAERYLDSGCGAMANESGIYKATGTCGDQFSDPDGDAYNMGYMGIPSRSGRATPTGFDRTIWFVTAGKCDGESAIAASGDKSYALMYVLEGGSIACLDNQ